MSPSCAFAPSANGISSYDFAAVSQPLWNGSSVLAFENHGTNLDLGWLCWGYDDSVNIDRTDASCDRRKAQSLLVANGTWYLRPFDTSTPDQFSQSQAYPIKYCLSEDKVPEKCQLQYVCTILGIVIACNFVKMAAMVATAFLVWDLEEPIFATVGDAVASYLERPDENTAGWCLMGSNETSAWRRLTLEQDTHKLYKPPKLRLLIAATSKTRYLTTMGLCILYLAAGSVLWFLSVKQAKQYYSMSQVWALGLGDINEHNTLEIQFQPLVLASESIQLIINILIANSFQLALSITYFLYNSLYTAQCGAIEWTSYTLKRKPLRVTHPRGQQRSTYWLQLPYTYGLLLSGFLMLMHFLISQAVFLARVQWYNDSGEEGYWISAVGYSPVGIMATCCVGGFLILFQLLHSLRPLNTGIPLHCNKSTVISASCHSGVPSSGNEQGARMSDVGENVALSRVMWGVVLQPKDNNGVGHCSFTSDQVAMPQRGERYR